MGGAPAWPQSMGVGAGQRVAKLQGDSEDSWFSPHTVHERHQRATQDLVLRLASQAKPDNSAVMSQRPLVGLKGNKIFPRTLGNIRSRNHRLRVFYTRAPVRSSSPSYRWGKRGPERGGYLLHVVTIDLPSLQSCKTGLVCVLSRYLRGKRASPFSWLSPFSFLSWG